jgi:hypothetical protein
MTLPIQPKYSVGQTIYKAYALWEEMREQCPDCLGTKEWSVKTPRGETFEIPCNTCEEGWYSTGTIRVWKDAPKVESLTIGSILIDTRDEKPISYMCHETGVGSGSIHYEDTLFLIREEATRVATAQAAENAKRRNAEQREREAREKRKSARKPSYHERLVKELERELKTLKKGGVAA